MTSLGLLNSTDNFEQWGAINATSAETFNQLTKDRNSIAGFAND